MTKSNKTKLNLEEATKEIEDTLERADELYKQVKENASEFYAKNKQNLHEAHYNLKEQTENLAKQVKAKPLTSLLIAAGVGFIISSIIRK